VKTCGDGVNNFHIKDVAMSNVCCKVLRATTNAKIARFCRNITVKISTESRNSRTNETLAVVCVHKPLCHSVAR